MTFIKCVDINRYKPFFADKISRLSGGLSLLRVTYYKNKFARPITVGQIYF